MSVAGTMAVRTLVLIEQFEIRDNSITHKPTGWRFTAYQVAPSTGPSSGADWATSSKRGKIFVRTRSKRWPEGFGRGISKREKNSSDARSLRPPRARTGIARRSAGPIIDSVAAEIILHGKSANEAIPTTTQPCLRLLSKQLWHDRIVVGTAVLPENSIRPDSHNEAESGHHLIRYLPPEEPIEADVANACRPRTCAVSNERGRVLLVARSEARRAGASRDPVRPGIAELWRVGGARQPVCRRLARDGRSSQ